MPELGLETLSLHLTLEPPRGTLSILLHVMQALVETLWMAFTLDER